MIQYHISAGVPGKRRRVELYSCTEALRDAMRELGHEVDQRPIEVGMSLDRYDYVLLGWAAINSIVSLYRVGAIWLAGELRRLGVPHNFYLNDWNLKSIYDAMRYCRANGKKWLASKILALKTYDDQWGLDHLAELVGTVDTLCYDGAMGVAATHLFPWGDHRRYLDALPPVSGAYPLDSSSMVPFTAARRAS